MNQIKNISYACLIILVMSVFTLSCMTKERASHDGSFINRSVQVISYAINGDPEKKSKESAFERAKIIAYEFWVDLQHATENRDEPNIKIFLQGFEQSIKQAQEFYWIYLSHDSSNEFAINKKMNEVFNKIRYVWALEAAEFFWKLLRKYPCSSYTSVAHYYCCYFEKMRLAKKYYIEWLRKDHLRPELLEERADQELHMFGKRLIAETKVYYLDFIKAFAPMLSSSEMKAEVARLIKLIKAHKEKAATNIKVAARSEVIKSQKR